MFDRVAELEATLRRCQEAHRRRDSEVGADLWRESYEVVCDAFGILLRKYDNREELLAKMLAARERRRDDGKRIYIMEKECIRLRDERDDARMATRAADARYFALLRRVREGKAA